MRRSRACWRRGLTHPPNLHTSLFEQPQDECLFHYVGRAPRMDRDANVGSIRKAFLNASCVLAGRLYTLDESTAKTSADHQRRIRHEVERVLIAEACSRVRNKLARQAESARNLDRRTFELDPSTNDWSTACRYTFFGQIMRGTTGGDEWGRIVHVVEDRKTNSFMDVLPFL
jgi:hypothetical protein